METLTQKSSKQKKIPISTQKLCEMRKVFFTIFFYLFFSLSSFLLPATFSIWCDTINKKKIFFETNSKFTTTTSHTQLLDGKFILILCCFFSEKCEMWLFHGKMKMMIKNRIRMRWWWGMWCLGKVIK